VVSIDEPLRPPNEGAPASLVNYTIWGITLRYKCRLAKDATPEERLIILRLQLNALVLRLSKKLGPEHVDESIDVFEIRRIVEDMEDAIG
jgi:hypothetical protein